MENTEKLKTRIELLNDLGNEISQTDTQRAEELFKLVDILDEILTKQMEEAILIRLFRESEYISGQEVYTTEVWSSTIGILHDQEKLKEVIFNMSLEFIHDFEDEQEEEEREEYYEKRFKVLGLDIEKPIDKTWLEFYMNQAKTASLNNLLSSLLLTNDGLEKGYISIDWSQIKPNRMPNWKHLASAFN